MQCLRSNFWYISGTFLKWKREYPLIGHQKIILTIVVAKFVFHRMTPIISFSGRLFFTAR